MVLLEYNLTFPKKNYSSHVCVLLLLLSILNRQEKTVAVFQFDRGKASHILFESKVIIKIVLNFPRIFFTSDV